MTKWALIAASVIWAGGLSIAHSSPFVDHASSRQEPKTEPKAKPEPKGQPAASMMGCVDEHEGHWVLVNDQTLAILADLAAEGFPTEGFAKHMGHKVTVRGTVNSAGSRPLFKVRSIEMISETCTSQK